MKIELQDEDHVLVEGAAWFDVKGFAVRIHSTHEGVAVDVFDRTLLDEGNSDDAWMAGVHVFDHELCAPEEAP